MIANCVPCGMQFLHAKATYIASNKCILIYLMFNKSNSKNIF